MHARTLAPHFGAERDRSSGALLLVALATALGLAFAAHFRLYHRVDWSLALWWGLKDWYLWGALAPLVIRLARRVPLRRPLWLAILIHSAAACSVAIAHATLAVLLSAMVEGLGGISFADAVAHLVVKKSTLSLLTYALIVLGARLTLPRHDATSRETGPEASTTRLLVRKGGRERFLDVGRVDRIEAEGNYTRIHAGEASYLERRTLSRLEAQLDSSRFLRVHRSHIVNLERVDRIEPAVGRGWNVLLADGTRIPLSRTYRRRLEERIGRSL